MALKIEWTHEAEKHLDTIIEYLEKNWTEKEIRIFFEKLEEGLSIIKSKPLQQKKSIRKPRTHEYQLSTQTTLFYCFDTKTVTVLALWSNKMNPKKLK